MAFKGDNNRVMKWALATLGLVCALSIVVAVFFDPEKVKACETPDFVMLNFVEDGPVLVNPDHIMQVIRLPKSDFDADKLGTDRAVRVDLRDQGFVIVKEKVATIAKKLCAKVD